MSALPSPRLAEAYEVLEVVRRGGLSTTFRARHKGTDELRAIDVLRPAPGDRDELERRLDAEARPFLELRHRHVARLVDAAVGAEGQACIVRGDVEGIPLRRLTGERRPSVALAVELLRQAADALAYLHGAGRPVGELSPEGFLLGRDAAGKPHVTLVDLGLAKGWQEEAALTAAGLFFGRLRYAAPEQFDEQGRRGAPGDVYAWGLVAYEVLTGRYPIVGTSASSLIAGHLFRPPMDFEVSDPDAAVPSEVRALVLAALEKAPADRPSADALARELELLVVPAEVDLSLELAAWIDDRRPAPSEEMDALRVDGADGADGAGDAEQAGSGAAASAAGTGTAPAAPDLSVLLAEARDLASREEFVEARDRVRQVLRQVPDHREGLPLLASLEACIKIQVEESKAHATQPAKVEQASADFAPPESTPVVTTRPIPQIPRGTEAGSQTVRIPQIDEHAVDELGAGEPGFEHQTTVRLDSGAVERGIERANRFAERQGAEPSDASTSEIAVPASPPPVSPSPPTAQPGVDPNRMTIPDAMVPGFPKPSTRRLDLREDGQDDGRTMPLSPDLLREVSEAPAPASQGASSAEPGSDDPATPLPGTVTMPFEVIEEKRRQAMERSVPERPPKPSPAEIDPALGGPYSDGVGTYTLPLETVTAARDAAEARREAESGQHESAQPPEPARPAAPAQTSAPAPGARTQPPPATTPPASPPPARPADLDQLGFGGGSAPAPFADPHARHGGRRGRGRSRGQDRGAGGVGAARKKGGGAGLMVGALLAAVVVFAVGYAITSGIDVRALVGLGDEAPVVPPSELAPVAEPGWLVLDAAPWGEIESITDAVGEQVPLRVRQTPVRLELPPGRYAVVVTDPVRGARETLSLEVLSGEATTERVELRAVSVDEYFRRVGW